MTCSAGGMACDAIRIVPCIPNLTLRTSDSRIANIAKGWAVAASIVVYFEFIYPAGDALGSYVRLGSYALRAGCPRGAHFTEVLAIIAYRVTRLVLSLRTRHTVCVIPHMPCYA